MGLSDYVGTIECLPDEWVIGITWSWCARHNIVFEGDCPNMERWPMDRYDGSDDG